MRAASTVLTLGFAAGLMTAPAAQAIGFGRVANATQLGQRLDFAAAVRLEPDEALERHCVSAEVSAGDNPLQPGQVRVTLEGSPGNPDRTVRVTTSTVIDEPVVTISVTLGCNSRTTRKFVAFIDPPGIEMALAVPPPDPALLVPQHTDSQVAPLVALLAPEPPRRAAPRTREPSVDRRPTRRGSVDGAAPRQVAGAADDTASASVSVSASVAAAASASASAPDPASAAGPAASDAAARPAPRVVAAVARPPTSARRSVTASKPTHTARLQLDAPLLSAAAASASVGPRAARTAAGASIGPLATARPPARAVAALVAASSILAPSSTAPGTAAAAGPQVEWLLHERQRVQAQDDSISRLQAEAALTRQTVAGLQTRLQRAESERYANPLVATLATVAALLALLLAATVWRRRRPATSPQWWKGAAGASIFGRHSMMPESLVAQPEAKTGAQAEAETGARTEARAHVTADAGKDADAPAPASRNAAPDAASDAASTAHEATAQRVARVDVSLPPHLAATSPRWATSPAAGAATLGVSAPMPLAGASSSESSSVEELIDLEQQAEFFVVLGQDDAAIELLSQHLQEGGAASPLPYLKLLEIYRRRDDRLAYESLRARFNRDFNAYAPAWEVDLQQGRSLEEYPAVLARLQRHWGTPARAIEALDASLFRRGPANTTFDLPAYRELLTLYSIAKERVQDVEGEEASAVLVDLLLPLDQIPAAAPVPRATAADRPGAARRADGRRPAPSSALTVDIDVGVAVAALPSQAGRVSGGGRPVATHHESLETVPSALRRPVGYPDESAFVDLELEPVSIFEPVVLR